MARRVARRSMKDSLIRPTAGPSRVTLIQHGMKYKGGQEPSRVFPVGPRTAQTIARKV